MSDQISLQEQKLIKKEFKNYNSKKICKNFTENFGRFKHRKIVLYGIGPETEILLNSVNEFNIVGLMDPNKKLKTNFMRKNSIRKNVIKIRPIIIIVKEEKTE